MKISKLLAANDAYAATHSPIPDPAPSSRVAVVTCMDARIDVFAVLGLRLGEAHVVRNAGARITDDVLRSLAVSVNLLGVDTVVVMQHTGCGLAGTTDGELRTRTGADIDFLPIANHAVALKGDLDTLMGAPYLDGVQTFAGLVFDVTTGRVSEVVRHERA